MPLWQMLLDSGIGRAGYGRCVLTNDGALVRIEMTVAGVPYQRGIGVDRISQHVSIGVRRRHRKDEVVSALAASAQH